LGLPWRAKPPFAFHDASAVSSRAMSRRTIGLAVIVAFSVLTPVAYASPPDATSFGGLYDNTDFDDAVAFIAGPLGAVSVCPASMASRLQLANTSVSTLAPVSSGPGRAPPSA